MPLEAKFSRSGFDFAFAMNSATERAANAGLTHMTSGVETIAAIGTVSRMKLNFKFR
jgi:hypothetical protein